MKKSVAILISIMLLFVITFAGCGSYAPKEQAAYDNYEYTSEGFTETPLEAEESVQVQERKLIEEVYITAQTKQYDEFINKINKAVSDNGGYIEKSSVTNSANSAANRYADLTVRIPAKNLSAFTNLVAEQSTVTSKSTTVSDVTLQYVDTQSHITALKTEQETLLGLLAEAGSLDDILVIQARLTEVRYQIESYESQLRAMDNQIDYATIYLTIHEVDREITLNENQTAWAKIGNNFKTAFYNIGSFFENLFVGVVSALPYLIVIAIIVGPIVYFLIIRPIKKRKKNKEE